MKRCVVSILIFCIMFIMLTGCGSNDKNQYMGSNAHDTEIVKSSELERTWQNECLHEDVLGEVGLLYRENGTTGTLKRYHESLSRIFSEDENLYVETFNSYYNNLDYDSMEQLEKDILNGLIFYFGDYFGGIGWLDLDVPVEKAWMVGEGENNTNSQKHRKIVFKLNGPHTDRFGLEMDFWINKYDKEEHSANLYSFGEENNPRYDARKGINDISSDSGIWANALRDYYNNEAYVAIDVNLVNTIIQEHKDFLIFMKEYMDIYKDYQLELREAQKKEEESRKSIEPTIGMTKEQVLEGAWGAPQKKNITETVGGTSEQWVYGNGKYIYFENGIVTAIQKTE